MSDRNKLQTVLNLKNIPRAGSVWSQWAAPGPDNAPLIMRDRSTQEIYALELQFR